MTLSSGSRLGPYEITAKLGEGGMGEVYRATDSKLKREVAIKVLPAAFTEDKERLARFEREAQLLAQLHHPNIASIFGLEESGGVRALVMELVEGPTLAERLASEPLALDDVLSIARQIAEALEEAHEKGIVHRDLKPQNVKVTTDGKVKVLDFGLAKALDPGAGSSADLGRSPTLMNSPTLTAAGTQLGVILGTAAYMAPEQARGGAADKRADIWAFGVVLYEMLAGRSLFAGDTVSDTLAGVLKTEISWQSLPESTPPALRTLLRRCLERNPRNRLHDIADARLVIDELLTGRAEQAGGASAAPVAQSRRGILAAAGIATALGLLIGGLSPWRPWAHEEDVSAPAFRLELNPPDGTTFGSGGLALSPDGTKIVFVARGADGRPQLWMRRLDSREAKPLPGTSEGRFPFWAPDSKRLGFFADARLKVTDLLGTPRTLATTAATTDARGGSWGADDTILYAPLFTGGLMRVAAAGGEPVPALPVVPGSPVGTYRFPAFLPDGKRFLVYASPGTGVEPGELYLGRLGSTDLVRLGEVHSAAVFAPPHRILYVKGDQLFAQDLDLQAEALAGEPQPLGVSLPGGVGVSGFRSLSVSRNGILAVRADQRDVTHPIWVDPTGKELGELVPEDGGYWYAPRLSPDGHRLLIARYGLGSVSGDIWLHDLDRHQATRLTFDEGDEQVAVWSPDGRTIAVSSSRGGARHGIYLMSSERPGQLREWQHSERFMFPSFYTASGKELVFEQAGADQVGTQWIAPAAGGGEPRELFDDPGAELAAVLSRDGRYIAYCSDATGSNEVYVRPLVGGDVVRVSTGGGIQPLWRPDGRELYYVAPNGLLMAAAVEDAEAGRYGTPQPLFDAHLEDTTDRQYDIAPDGRRFLLNHRAGSDSEPIVVITGWESAAKR
jgi:Tol biopolymer transport system component/aminoglycoside phosphotransferase (APT) family kinase protein